MTAVEVSGDSVWVGSADATLVYTHGAGVSRGTVILDRIDARGLRDVSRRERAIMRALLGVALETLGEADRLDAERRAGGVG